MMNLSILEKVKPFTQNAECLVKFGKSKIKRLIMNGKDSKFLRITNHCGEKYRCGRKEWLKSISFYQRGNIRSPKQGG